MKPPYEITSLILKRIASISYLLGEVNANFLSKQSPQLRKQNRIKTIHSSLQIEGNTLTEEHITALVENKRVIGPQKEIEEVLNAIKVYEELKSYRIQSEKDFLKAHKGLMQGLIKEPGKYRTKGVGVVKGEKIEHLAPPSERVPYLMKDLFKYLQDTEELTLLKSCVFHYELEFIHPFMDGNGRMGRLWQTAILTAEFPVFEFLPFETLINQNQKEYYHALSSSDKAGKSTAFIEYMLELIEISLLQLLNYKDRTLKDTDRLDYFLSITTIAFNRNDYMQVFKNISSATASRDLKKGVKLGWIQMNGEKNKTIYKKS